MTIGTDVIGEIVLDHQRIKHMLDTVADKSAANRMNAFDELARVIKAHETAEQQVVHPAMEAIEEEVADERTTEEANGEKILAQLRTMDVDDPAFNGLFDSFRDAVLQHAAKEEREEHPRLRASLEPDRLMEMAGEYTKAEAAAAKP